MDLNNLITLYAAKIGKKTLSDNKRGIAHVKVRIDHTARGESSFTWDMSQKSRVVLSKNISSRIVLTRSEAFKFPALIFTDWPLDC